MKRNYIIIAFICLVLVSYILFSQKGIEAIKNMRHQLEKITVVIDAGHGGFDPGKIGINNALEKEINLSIAYKLKSLLEQNDIQVIMTRTDDNGLNDDKSRFKKSIDMKKRVDIINSSDALIAISIHQNSFTQESSSGAQVFYYPKSSEGKLLAEIIQEGIKEFLKDGNHRLAKSNGSYYMLRQTKCPLVIVECGFLSNWKEAKLLSEEAYQEKIAWAIHLGILEYINSK